MSTCPDLRELSSYLDGECRDADRVARHIQSCPDCARVHLEMRKLSSHMQSVRVPEVSVQFAANVLARCEEPRQGGLWHGVPVSRLALAAAVLLVSGIAAITWSTLSSGRSSETMAAPSPIVNPAWHDEAELVEALARLMDEGADLALFSAPDYNLEDDIPAAVPVDQMLEALADDLPEEIADTDESEDFAMLLDELVAMDAQSLAELLQTYESEG